MPQVIEIEKQSAGKALVLPVGITDPPLYDKISANENLVDLEKAEVKFFMRPILSRTPTTNGEKGEAIWPPNKEGYNIKYMWHINDTVEGEKMAWWWFKKGEEVFETPEFPITFSDHGPGIGVKIGAIFDGVYDHMPVTVDALRKSPTFGERRIQKYATLIQLRVMGEYVQPDEEIEKYSLPLLDYFSKRVALELCSPGIDYWGRQHKTISANYPTEMTSFPETVKSLESLRNRLKKELEQDWRDLRFLVPNLPQRKAMNFPASTTEYSEHYDADGNMIRRRQPAEYITKNPELTGELLTGVSGLFGSLTLGFFPFP